jgi:hypothetical protein
MQGTGAGAVKLTFSLQQRSTFGVQRFGLRRLSLPSYRVTAGGAGALPETTVACATGRGGA